MEYVSVTSSVIAAVGYDDESSTLGVKLLSGKEYHYFGVPRDVYEGCLTASSVGKYYNAAVKGGGYPFREIK